MLGPKASPEPKPPAGAKIPLKGKVIFIGPPTRKTESIEAARDAILRVEREKAQRRTARIVKKAKPKHKRKTLRIPGPDTTDATIPSEVDQTIGRRSKRVQFERRPITTPRKFLLNPAT